MSAPGGPTAGPSEVAPVTELPWPAGEGEGRAGRAVLSDSDSDSDRRRPNRLLLLAGLGVVLLSCGVATWALVTRAPAAAGNASGTPAAATAPVTRTTLVQRQQLNGTLGYAGSYAIPGPGSGVLTWLPQVGQTVSRGQQLYGLDGRAVPLFYGSTPLWRTLSLGVSDGQDVRELEQNLAALGFGSDVTVDDHFSSATQAAVERWQHHLGVTESGSVAVGDLVMEPGALRVTAVPASPGGQAQGTLIQGTGLGHAVQVGVPLDQQELARVGTRVTIELPDGRTTPGRVSWVGPVTAAALVPGGVGQAGSGAAAQAGQPAGQSGNSSGGQSGAQPSTVPVQIELLQPKDGSGYDAAPVTVDFAGQTRANVLAVPVTALLARQDGSYEVDVIGPGGTRRAVPVTLGAFAGGQVEVNGAGLAAGQRVEVPSS